jgi:hypothetical protein
MTVPSSGRSQKYKLEMFTAALVVRDLERYKRSVQKTWLTGRSPFKRRRFGLDCRRRRKEEEEDQEEEEEEEEKEVKEDRPI